MTFIVYWGESNAEFAFRFALYLVSNQELEKGVKLQIDK